MPPPTSATEPNPAPLTNPNLSATLRADYDALMNDVQQANQLAADFQRQLAGKSNEVADFRRLFEKTQTDLGHLQKSIDELRQERHRLANEAMRAVAFERKLTEMTAERNRLRIELDVMRQGIASNTEDLERRLRERDAQVTRLAHELDTLREQLLSGNAPAPTRGGGDPAVKAVLADLWSALNRLQTTLDPKNAVPAFPAPSVQAPAASEEFIDISFDK